MFEKEAEEYAIENYENCVYDGLPYANDSRAREQAFKDGAELGYNKANEWHYVKDGDLPKENQKCYFIYSNTYENFNKVSFAKSNIKVLTGIYSFFLDDEGNQTTQPCFYDDINDDEISPLEVYAWKEIVLPDLKEIE